MLRRAFHNGEPGVLPPNAPNDVVKVELGKRLQRALVERGWNQSELARRAASHTDDGKFGRDNVSNYVRGVVLPGPVHLRAMATALDLKPSDLLPSRGRRSVEERLPSLEVRDAGDGMAWLIVNQAVDWPTATKVVTLVKGESA